MKLIKLYWRIKCFVKKMLLKIIFGKRFKIGKNSHFRKNISIILEKDAEIIIGDNCFFNRGVSISCMKRVVIGDGTGLGENVKVYDQDHIFTYPNKSFLRQGHTVGEVNIGKNCWVCSNVVFTKNVTVGDNCVIGAGCVINRDIPPHSFVRPGNGLIIEPIIYPENK